MNNSRARGRPIGDINAREDILNVARRRFLAHGYDRVSVRSIASEVGVDAALVSYYFGSKRGLFAAAMELAVNPAELLADEISGPLDTLPVRLLSTVMAAWEAPETGDSLRSFLQAVIRDPDEARAFRELIESEMITRIAERLGGADASRRAAVATSQIAGLILARYVLRIEPLASTPSKELVRRIAPNLRVALFGTERRPGR